MLLYHSKYNPNWKQITLTWHVFPKDELDQNDMVVQDTRALGLTNYIVARLIGGTLWTVSVNCMRPHGFL